MKEKLNMKIDGLDAVVTRDEWERDCVHWSYVADGSARADHLIENVLARYGIGREDFAESGEEKISSAHIYYVHVEYEGIPGSFVYANVYLETDDGRYCYWPESDSDCFLTAESQAKVDALPEEDRNLVPDMVHI